MFNKKNYRIDKKKYFIKKKLKSLIENNKNNILLKNNKNNILLKYVFLKKINILFKGNKNVCSITGRYKTIFNSLKIGRHSIRRLADISKLPNYSKLSW